MKIAVVHNAYQQRGGEDVVFEQECALLRRAGHQVAIYRRTNDEIAAMRPLARACDCVWSRHTHQDFGAFLRREAPDCVHVHNTFAVISPSLYWACGNAGIPVVQTLHNYRLLCPQANFLRDGRPCETCLDHGLLHSVVHGCYRGSRPSTAVIAGMLAFHRWRRTWTTMVSRYIALSRFARESLSPAVCPPRRSP